MTQHSVPALKPGDKVVPELDAYQVTDDAASPMVIKRNRPRDPITATIAGEMDAAAVAKAATEGVAYGWRDQYTADNLDKGTQLFSQTHAEVTVNPWPSETDDCAPITVDWENEKQHVIRPGEKQKVGKVNADEASLERMVVEAYDPQGNFLATNDTAASGGGEGTIEVDPATGEVTYEMPEYKGTKLKDQQSVLFRVLAKPRTVEQLQGAIENAGGFGTANESSNILQRYSTVNEIDSHQWSLDDTQFHAPNYSPEEIEITSGISSDTNEVITEPNYRQEIVFTQTGDKIADLKKKREEGGSEVDVVLDTHLVRSGWEAKLNDPEAEGYDPAKGEYSVIVTAPTDPAPSFVQPRVIVTYSNGSKDFIPLTVVVNPNNTQVTEPTIPAPQQGPAGESMTAALGKRPVLPGYDAVTPASYEVDPATVPDGWTVTVDGNGNVTATPDKTVPSGDIINPKIKITYPDGTTDVADPVFVVKSKPKPGVPDYPVEATKPGTAVTHNIDKAPEGSTYSFGMDGDKPITTTEDEGWKYTIDPETGNVTVTPPDDAKPGDKHKYDVTVTNPDGSTDKVPVTTVVSLTNNYEAEPYYPAEISYPGDTATSLFNVRKPKDLELAQDTPYEIVPGEGFRAEVDDAGNPIYNDAGNPIYSVNTANGNWLVSLDKNGNVKSEIPTTAQPGDNIQVPVRVKYSDGSVDNTVASVSVVDNPTRPVPFDVVYEYDPEIPAGEYRVVTEGKAGEEKQKRDGTWKQTTAPTNEVVKVGTKPAEAAKDVTWTVPTPYSTVTRPNPKLAPGETKVVQEGVNGERKYTAKFTSKGDQASVVESEDVKEPVEEIIEYGPRLDDQELVTETKRKIPFETKIVYDDTLKAGEQVIEKQGVVGEETVTSTQKLVDGKPSGDPVVTTNTTTEKQDAVIRVGGKTTGTNTESFKTEAPYKVVVKYDPNMPAGESKVTTEGVPGEKTVTIKRDIVNSKPGDPQITEEITKEPVDEVITVGTKQATATDKVQWTEPIPFGTTLRENPDLAPGETKVVQEGKNGEASYAAVFSGTNGEATVEETKARTEPVERIVEYGPKVDDSTVVTKTEKPVPFETEIVFDDTLEEGEQAVDQQGKLGTEVVTSTQKIVNGKPSGDPEVTTERTKEPVPAKIRVGTKTTGETTNSVEAEVPFGVKVEFDPTIPAGTSETVTEGKPGKKTVTVTQKVTNSQPDGEATVEEKVTEQPVDQVIKVGTKPSETSEKITWTAQVPFEVETRPNPDLKPGEVKVVQKGEPGEKTFTADFTTKGDDATVKPEEKQTKDPVKEIIEYGPQAEDTSVVTKTEKPVPFETEIVFDDSLKAGEQVVDKQGVNGTEVETSTQKIVDGKPSGEPTVTTERTQEPTNAVIRVGTKTEGTNTTESEVEVPFETEIQFDDSLPAGTQETVQEGKPGKDKVTTTQTIENSKVTGTTTETERVEEPVKKIIKVGTKGDTTSKTVEWTESTPFEVEVRENPDLKAGETKVVQEGKPGEVKHTVTVTSNNGEISTDDSTETVSEPTKQIIEVGTAPSQTELTDKHTEQLPFETLIEVDPNLEAGKVFEDQPGAFGSKDVTKVWQLKDGQVVGDPEVSENVTKEPTPRKLRVGAKQATETSEVPVQQDRGFYGAELTKPGQSASQNIQDGAEGNTYEIGALPAGWTATVDENGMVTATPPADAKSGDYAEIPVTVTPKGGKPYVANAVFIVKDDQVVDPTDPADPTDPEIVTAPTYNPDVITAGDTKTVTINTGHVEGNSYELGEVPAGWTVTIDETTGELTVTPPADTPSGTIKEIPVKVTTKDGEVFDVKTVIGVVSDNCGCDPVEPTDPTDKPDPSDNPDPSENPAPTDKPDPTDKPEPTDKPDPTDKPEPTDKPDPTDKPEPTDKPDKQSSEGSSVWPVLVPLILVPAIIGRIFGHNQGSSFPDLSPKDPSKPETPAKPTDKPKTEPKDEQPKDEAKATESPEAPRTEDVESTDVTSTVQETTAPTTGAAQNTAAQSTAETSSTSAPSSSSSSSSRHLANTGASVLGIIAAGLALIAGAVLILRPGRRKES